MHDKIHRYPLLIKEVDLDAYQHVNNATYLKMFEEARWDFMHSNGYGFKKIHDTGWGPVVLETNIRYLKELRLRDEIIIVTKFLYFENKVGKLLQEMMRGDVICCSAEFTIGFFDLKARKLILPTEDWLKAIGLGR